MTLTETQKFTKHICRLLKVTYINLPIGRTDKGNFSVIFNENGDWDMMLDSVPLSTKDSLKDENNIELKAMVEKYWFELELVIKTVHSDGLAPMTIATLKEQGVDTSDLKVRETKKKVARPTKHGNTKATKSHS